MVGSLSPLPSLPKFVGWCWFSHPARKTSLRNIFQTEDWETSTLRCFYPILSSTMLYAFVKYHLGTRLVHSFLRVFSWVFGFSLAFFPLWGREAVLHASEEGAGMQGNPGGWKNQTRPDCMIKKLHENMWGWWRANLNSPRLLIFHIYWGSALGEHKLWLKSKWKSVKDQH